MIASTKFNHVFVACKLLFACLVIVICLNRVSFAVENEFDERINHDNIFSLATAEINAVLNDYDVSRCVSLWKNLKKILGSNGSPRQDGKELTLVDVQASLLIRLKFWLETKLTKNEQDQLESQFFDPWHVAYLSVSKCAHLIQLNHQHLLRQRAKPEKPVELRLNVEVGRSNFQRTLSDMQFKLEETEQKEDLYKEKLAELSKQKEEESKKLLDLNKKQMAQTDFAERANLMGRHRALTHKLNSINEQIRLVHEAMRDLSRLKEETIVQQMDHLQSDRERAPLRVQLANCRERLRKQLDQVHKRRAEMELELWKKRDLLEKCRQNLTKILSLINNI